MITFINLKTEDAVFSVNQSLKCYLLIKLKNLEIYHSS